MVLSDPDKSGLESVSWVDGNVSRTKTKRSPLKNKSLLFFCAVYHSKKHITPTMLLLPSSTSSQIFYNTEKATKIWQANSPNTTNNDQNIFTN